MKKLKAIFFDIDDTLYSTSDFAALARRNSVKAMIDAGLKMDEEDCLAELREVIAEFSSNYEQHFDKLFIRLPNTVYQGLNPAALIASAIVAYHETKFRYLVAFEDAREALKRIAATDLTLGVISAGLTMKQFEKLVRLKVLPLFDPQAIFISEQIGISKPNPKLYQRACELVGCEPSEAIYVGDNPVLDIDASKMAGMITVLTRRSASLTRARGDSEPDFEIHNFWDLLDILSKQFQIELPAESNG